MLGKSTASGASAQWRIYDENNSGKTRRIEGNGIVAIGETTYIDENLLKVCVSGQSKLTRCHKNSAAPYAHICDPWRVKICAQKKIAGTSHFDPLTHVNPLAGRNDAAGDEIAYGTARGGACGRVFAAIELHTRSEAFCFWGHHIEPAAIEWA
jgi:hypothetical protein